MKVVDSGGVETDANGQLVLRDDETEVHHFVVADDGPHHGLDIQVDPADPNRILAVQDRYDIAGKTFRSPNPMVRTTISEDLVRRALAILAG